MPCSENHAERLVAKERTGNKIKQKKKNKEKEKVQKGLLAIKDAKLGIFFFCLMFSSSIVFHYNLCFVSVYIYFCPLSAISALHAVQQSANKKGKTSIQLGTANTKCNATHLVHRHHQRV